MMRILVLLLLSISFLGSIQTWRSGACRRIQGYVDCLPSSRFDLRVSLRDKVTELTAVRLLRRVSPPERLDGPPMFKCAITYDVALRIAKDLGVPLNDLIFEPA